MTFERKFHRGITQDFENNSELKYQRIHMAFVLFDSLHFNSFIFYSLYDISIKIVVLSYFTDLMVFIKHYVNFIFNSKYFK